MSTFALNPYVDPVPWNRIRIAGNLVAAVLIEVNGVKVEDEWKSQKSKESSGEVNVFNGTKGLREIELLLEAPDKETFDDLRVLYDALAPVPGLGGGTTSSTKTSAPTYAIGSPAAPGSSSDSGGGAGSFTIPSTTTSSSGGSSSSSGNPGPRPPTVRIELAQLAYHGCTAVARRFWDGPNHVKATNSWQVKLGLIQDKPPTPAGTGAMSPPKPGAQYTIGGGDPQAAADAAKTRAAADAAGT